MLTQPPIEAHLSHCLDCVLYSYSRIRFRSTSCRVNSGCNARNSLISGSSVTSLRILAKFSLNPSFCCIHFFNVDCIGSMATHPNDCFLLLIFREFFEQFSYFRYFFFFIFYVMCLFLLLCVFIFGVFLLLKSFRYVLIGNIMLLVSFICLGMI